MKVLIDTGVFIHSAFAEDTSKVEEVTWGDIKFHTEVYGICRKKEHKDSEYQKQMDALFTIGRLIREQTITAYEYSEIICERLRGNGKNPIFNALRNCKTIRCPSALERAKFRNTMNLDEYLSKGGKKDVKKKGSRGKFSQVSFFEWLNALSKTEVDAIIKCAKNIRLSNFEIESLGEIDRFQFLCSQSANSDSYPDIFHLWTAERNSLNVFLTMEKKFPNFISCVERNTGTQMKTKVFRPLELLNYLGIEKLDPIPADSGRFYNLFEALQ